jgi:hypothetical protein
LNLHLCKIELEEEMMEVHIYLAHFKAHSTDSI